MTVIITKDSPFCDKSVLEYIKSLSLSSKMIKYLKYRENGITVGGVRVTVRHILRDGEVLCLALEDTESSETATPSNIPIDIVYEDDSVVVVNKPPFMPTHPSHGHHNDTLANALAYYYNLKGIPFVFRPINRLDRNTSGLVIVAKNKIAACRMTEFMKEHKIKKSYIALLKGELQPDDEDELHVIDKHLHRTEKSIIVREICPPDTPDADRAITYYKILRKNSDCTLVEAFPITGRTHQLRVHFASLGHPIIGDDLYGSEDEFINRHALHAHKLEFPTIDESNIISLSAPLPNDILKVKKKYFKD